MAHGLRIMPAVQAVAGLNPGGGFLLHLILHMVMHARIGMLSAQPKRRAGVQS
jgi:hypothetical protein